MLKHWEELFKNFVLSQVAGDPAHDILHLQRVVATAKQLASQANACLDVIIPAAWLHDCVVMRKSESLRSQASRLSAQRARAQLILWKYPNQYIDGICHAIEAHSFAAGIVPTTLEAQIIQDADRLDALGAIGIARCFSIGGALHHPIYMENDPFCKHRPCDDKQATLDHFYQKLLCLPSLMCSDVGRQEAMRRVQFMQLFLDELQVELYADEGALSATVADFLERTEHH
ncbi:HD domain-containing protein [Celerinatantimonas sp. YJH-8]|uniref:HD domain-containing protein n=1 Tax=Celerinatantimonas sp. YJH-8 TaxID=3228714 RepID=UPI0038C7B91B